MLLDRIPASVAFCDVETTGLAQNDRIVSFGGIGMISSELAARQLNLRYSYLSSILVRKTTAMQSKFMDFRICLFASRTRSRSTPPRYGASSHPTRFSLPTTQRSTSDSSIAS